MKLPYVLLADADPDRADRFETVFEKHIAYATVTIVEDGQSLLDYMSGCEWKDFPSLIVLTDQLPDIPVPDVLRELLTDTRYLSIPKLILTPSLEHKEVEECRTLGIRHFHAIPMDLFELETTVRVVDDLLQTELNSPL